MLWDCRNNPRSDPEPPRVDVVEALSTQHKPSDRDSVGHAALEGCVFIKERKVASVSPSSHGVPTSADLRGMPLLEKMPVMDHKLSCKELPELEPAPIIVDAIKKADFLHNYIQENERRTNAHIQKLIFTRRMADFLKVVEKGWFHYQPQSQMSNIFYQEAMRKVGGLKTFQSVSDWTYENCKDHRYLLLTLASCFRTMVLWYFDHGGAKPNIEAQLEVLKYYLPCFYSIAGFFERSQADVRNALASKGGATLPAEGSDICCEYIVNNIDSEKDSIKCFDFSAYYQSVNNAIVCECKENGWAYKAYEKKAKEYGNYSAPSKGALL